MIETYGKNIPLQLQVGIVAHATERGSESPIVKKYLKKFFKQQKSNPSLKKSITTLYSDPIDEVQNSVQICHLQR